MRSHERTGVRAMVGVAMLMCGCVGDVLGQAATVPAGQKGGEAYVSAVLSMLEAVEKDLPKISRAAQEAAEFYLADEKHDMAIGGSRAVVLEIRGRSGGLVQLKDHFAPQHDFKGVVIYFLREDALEQDAFNIRHYRNTGSKVAVFARPFLRERAEKRFKLEADWFIDTHAAYNGGLFEASNRRWLVPTDEVGGMIAGWAWVGEFVAACTRGGNMPAMHLGWVFGGMPRWEKIKDLKFHAEKPQAVEAMKLGKAYLDEQRKTLEAIAKNELGNVAKVAEMAITARDAHKGVFAFVEGHATIWAFDVPHDTGLFTRAGYWTELRRDVELERDDFLFGVGYAGVMQDEKFAKLAERCREKGMKLAWTFSGHTKVPPTTQVAGVINPPEGEPVIDQHWDYGDAVVEVPGYDIKIIPVSGVAQLTVFQMVNAEIFARRPEQAAVKK